MPTFPSRVNDLIVLIIKMIQGYTENPTVFTHGDPIALQGGCCLR